MSKVGITAQNGALRSSQCSLKIPKRKKNVQEESENISRAASQNSGEIVEALTLFEVVSMGKRAIQSVVDDWIEAYKEDQDIALLDLINFFIQCSGCKGMVTAEMFQSRHNSTVINKMSEEFDKETGLQYKKFMAYPWILSVTWPMAMDSENYPLVKPGSYWKKFKTNFSELIVVLMQQSQYNIIYDGYLMDTVISLLTGLAESQVRALRHTSTLAAMKLLTALVSVTLNLHDSFNNNQRLYEVEKNRLTGRRTNYRLDQLEKKKEELEMKHLEIQTMINAVLKGIFLQRYRDVVPDIRALCIEEMGVWMKMCPHMFLNDSYLKYIGWMLNDKQPNVRLKSLLSLQGLYDKKKLISKMDLFTNRFKDRIVSMTLDRDKEVAAEAMKLLIYMSQNCEDVFMSEDCEILYQFVYAAHRPLAAAAGEFLYKRLLSQQRTEEELICGKKGKFGQNARYLKTLLIFFLDNELHDHVTYLVDSLWDCASSLLKDWECMTALLLEDCKEEEEGLNNAHKSALIEVIIASMQQAMDGHPPAGRELTRKVLSAKEKKLQFEDCARITEHFILVLPQLLSKYSAHANEVANLLQIPQYFDLDVYCTAHLEKHLDALLKQMKDIAEKHSDLKVLEACSRSYSFLCNEQLIIYSQVCHARNQLIDEFVIKLNQLLDNFLQEGENVCTNEGGICQISTSLRKVAAFYNAHNLTRWNLYNRTSQLLDLEMECRCVPAEVVLPALQCTYYALLWQLTTIMERSSSKETLLLLRTQTMHFCEICRNYLNHNNKAIQEQSFTLLCDLLMILSHQETEDEVLKVLSYSPDSSLQSELLTFIQDHVFIKESKEMKEKWEERKEEDYIKLNQFHQRRRILSSYCKLIVYNVVEMAAATEIYKQYMTSYNEFGDIIKETMSRTQQQNRTERAKTLILCLQQNIKSNWNR
ncbi:cohesin subunit SA-2 isoform X2 [Microcaecilia unicolor]|uniref:Cohesin subunit SA n=1 Tax=Microcaecilia unicolor TaxID=1415580 RepID=A0A6P7Y0D9_9AMPH|nr:cohesin subunit SA-2-like isoform X2 [Microcaecilia unicolor]